MDNTYTKEDEIKYSKLLSSLFSSIAIVALSVLCLLNHLTLDFYVMIVILKIVVPGAFCLWFIGFVIGKILDNYNQKIVAEEIKVENEAYEQTSIFAGDPQEFDEIEEEQ